MVGVQLHAAEGLVVPVAIGAAWTRSGCLAQERIEARLKSRFAGRTMRGLSDSSFNRYKDPEATALPDAEVLAALAELFGVGDDEAERWSRLLEEARTEARRRRAAVRGHRRAPDRPDRTVRRHSARRLSAHDLAAERVPGDGLGDRRVGHELGERETSMTVHVQPDRYRWNDQLP